MYIFSFYIYLFQTLSLHLQFEDDHEGAEAQTSFSG